MKTTLVLSVLITALSQSAFAKTSTLNCSTTGDALALLTVKGTTVSVSKSEADPSEADIYQVLSGAKDVVAGSSATLIAQKSGASQFGGSFDKAIVLRVLDGQKSAVLAMDGVVYKLRCF